MDYIYIELILLAIIVIIGLYTTVKINTLFSKEKDISDAVKEQNNSLNTNIDKLNDKLLDSAKENQKQIEKNNELFNNILNAQNNLTNDIQKNFTAFNESLNKYINERFDALTAALNSRLDAASSRMDSRMEQLIKNTTESLDKLKNESSKGFEQFVVKVEGRLDKISSKVDERLKEGFDSVDKTFKDIIEGIAKIAEAQKKIEQLSGEVVSLQQVLSDKKTRGIFGEVQLENVLKAIFGENKELYDLQYEFNYDGNRVVVDAILKTPQLGIISIDSKFPLENYTRMVDRNIQEKAKYATAFKQNLKKHIDDISSKYIIKGKTANMAILFLPAEAIFAEINAYHQDIIDYAYKKSVWLASPTTLMALLTTIQAIIRDIKTQKQAKKIQEELMKLSKNFSLYKDRWERFMKDIERVNKTAKDINVTTEKISSAFTKIENVEFEDKNKAILK